MTTNESKPLISEKSVSIEEFERISKKFRNVQVRSFQASGSEETFIVKWVTGQNKPFSLVRLYAASF